MYVYLLCMHVCIICFLCHFMFSFFKIKLNQLHAVSRTQQGRQRELGAVLEALRVKWRNSMPSFALTSDSILIQVFV